MHNILEEHFQSKTKDAIPSRTWSALFDYFVMLVFFFIYTRVFGDLGADGKTYTVTGVMGSGPLIFWIFYFIILETVLKGTPGHRIMGLSVIPLVGNKLTLIQVIKRRLCDVIDFVWCFGLIASILVRNTVYHQRLGDIWAKTIVIEI